MTFETKPMRGTIRMHRLNSRSILVAVSALALASSTCASRTGKTEMGQGRGRTNVVVPSKCFEANAPFQASTIR